MPFILTQCFTGHVAILSTVAVSGAHGADSVAALTSGYRSAFAIAFAVLGLEPREGPAGWPSVLTAPDVGEIALWQPTEWR